jgi:hypothetical protein
MTVGRTVHYHPRCPGLPLILEDAGLPLNFDFGLPARVVSINHIGIQLCTNQQWSCTSANGSVMHAPRLVSNVLLNERQISPFTSLHE